MTIRRLTLCCLLISSLNHAFARSDGSAGFSLNSPGGPIYETGVTTSGPPHTTTVSQTFILDPAPFGGTAAFRVVARMACGSNGLDSSSKGSRASLSYTLEFDQPIEIVSGGVSEYYGPPGDRSAPAFPFSHAASETRRGIGDVVYNLSASYSSAVVQRTMRLEGALASSSLLPVVTADVEGIAGRYETRCQLIVSRRTTVRITGSSSVGLRGRSQDFPNLPVERRFPNGPSGEWFDPPMASGYNFKMNGSSLFTHILNFPQGIDADNAYNVWVGPAKLGVFGVGDTVDFAALAGGGGVREFRVTGINPFVDGANPEAFPIQLQFNTPTADFNMEPIPAPSIAITRLADGKSEITFEGDLETSINADVWSRVPGAVSPHVFQPDEGKRAFFRASKPE